MNAAPRRRMLSAMLRVHVIPVLEDNYAYLMCGHTEAVLVDPGEALPVERALDAAGLSLSHILITHRHHDHTGGLDALVRRYQPVVVAPEDASSPLPGVDMISTPGHAFPHIAYYVREPGWLFSGDSLFGAGCGRLAGDSAGVMWASLQKLAALPDETLVFFGHEYTLDNLAFAAAVEPDNPAIAARRARVAAALAAGGYSTPSTIAEEKATNPFLRAADLETFARLRTMKNTFSV